MFMKKVLTPLALLCAIVLIGAGCTTEQDSTTNTNTTTANTNVEVMEKDDTAMEKDGDAMMEEDHSDDSMEKDDAMEADTAMEKDGEAMDSEAAMEKDDTTGDVMEKTDTAEETVMEKDESESTDDTVMENDDSMEKGEEVSQTPGTYVDYNESQVASAATNGDAVLFFHASWCPSCKTLDSSISSGEVPAGLTIMKVNYDKENDLRKKYGVTYQHTLVQVDANGDMIQKWSGGNTLDSIVSKVQ